MKTLASVLFCILLSFFLLLPFTNFLLEKETHQPTNQLLMHFAGFKEIPQVFDEQEKSHLQDVTILVRIMFLILVIDSIYLFRNKEWKRYSLRSMISISSLIVISAIMPFETIFSYFHKILFPQGNYSFPAESTLIQYYPQMFFRNCALAIICGAVIISLALFAISKLSLKKGIKKSSKKKI